ncbi:hypothetical protein LAZ67_18001151 [Cordylochernes scorpioides]|uniref:Transposase n=1 Tax=Cordylochernes scorpioides TaxID=51811 RepID=A0ABY6LIA0_9ARAC|nr:hypothetical protein LAZ67_18001151 [Cordylochernes scorpioides]
MMTYQLMKKLSISKGSVLKLLSDVGYQKLCSKWVLKLLTQEIMQNQKEICLDLIESYPGPASEAFKGVIMCDETWFYHYGPSLKCQSMQWTHKMSLVKKKPRLYLSRDKIMITDKCKTSHSATVFLAQISRYGWTLMPHPAYSPDLPPSEFYLFATKWRIESIREAMQDSREGSMTIFDSFTTAFTTSRDFTGKRNRSNLPSGMRMMPKFPRKKNPTITSAKLRNGTAK